MGISKEKLPRLDLCENTGITEIEKWIDSIKRSGKKAVRVYVDGKYPQSNISFLKNLSGVESLRIQDEKGVDMTFINEMHDLQDISGEPCKMNFIVENANLRNMDPTWEHGFGISKNCVNLKSFSIRKCKNFKNLWTDLAELENLEYLCIVQGNMENCLDFRKMKNLNRLILYYLPKLHSLDGIEVLSDTLKILRLETGKRIVDYSILGKLKNLEELFISNRSVIEDLSFLELMPKLKIVKVAETKIANTKSNLEILRKNPCVFLLHTGLDKIVENLR